VSKYQSTVGVVWGNTVVPGLSDKELFETNWNRKKNRAEKKAASKRMTAYWANLTADERVERIMKRWKPSVA